MGNENDSDWGRVDNQLLALLLQLNQLEQMTASISPPGAEPFVDAVDRFRGVLGTEIERQARGDQ
jgi:hypothetical protein